MLKYMFLVQTILYLQPDAKLENGLFWIKFWLGVVESLLQWL